MDIHHADPAYRRRSLGLFVAIIAACAVLLWRLDTWLASLVAVLATEDPATVRRWLRVLFVALGAGLAVPTAILGLHLSRFAEAARGQRRFPPAQARTLRDVRVLRDAAALTWARRVEWTGRTMLWLAGAWIAAAAWAAWRFG